MNEDTWRDVQQGKISNLLKYEVNEMEMKEVNWSAVQPTYLKIEPNTTYEIVTVNRKLQIVPEKFGKTNVVEFTCDVIELDGEKCVDPIQWSAVSNKLLLILKAELKDDKADTPVKLSIRKDGVSPKFVYTVKRLK